MFHRAGIAMGCLVLVASQGWGQKESGRDDSAEKKAAAIEEGLLGKWDSRATGTGEGTVLVFESKTGADEKKSLSLRITHYERDTDKEGVTGRFLSVKVSELESKIVGEGTKLKVEKPYAFKIPTFDGGVVGETSVPFLLDGDKLILNGGKVVLRDLDPLKREKGVTLKGTWNRMK